MKPLRMILILIVLGVFLFAASSDANLKISKRVRFRPPVRPKQKPNGGRPTPRPPGRPRG